MSDENSHKEQSDANKEGDFLNELSPEDLALLEKSIQEARDGKLKDHSTVMKNWQKLIDTED